MHNRTRNPIKCSYLLKLRVSLLFRVFMCVRAMDSNISSKQKELEKLLEVLRIKAETYFVKCHIAATTERISRKHTREGTNTVTK